MGLTKNTIFAYPKHKHGSCKHEYNLILDKEVKDLYELEKNNTSKFTFDTNEHRNEFQHIHYVFCLLQPVLIYPRNLTKRVLSLVFFYVYDITYVYIKRKKGQLGGLRVYSPVNVLCFVLSHSSVPGFKSN